VTENKKPRSATKAKQSAVSPQFWALNPMVSMVGMAGWVEMMKESSQFFSERLEKDLEAQRELLNCRSLEDVLRVQSKFCKNALEQYTAEFKRVTELWSRTTASGLSEAMAPRARNYDDIPL
jgi:hypothetical protein